MSTWEKTRHLILGTALIFSLFFAVWEWAILSGFLHATVGCTPAQCMQDMFLVALVCMIYHATCMAGLLARRPMEVGWELLIFLLSIVPLIVLIYYSVRDLFDTYDSFKRYSWWIMWLVEFVDVIEVFLVMLQFTRRSSMGFGVVDDAGHRI